MVCRNPPTFPLPLPLFVTLPTRSLRSFTKECLGTPLQPTCSALFCKTAGFMAVCPRRGVPAPRGGPSPSPSSSRSLPFSSKHSGNRFQKNLEIEHEVPILDISAVQEDRSFKGRVFPRGDLPKSRYARLDVEPSQMFQTVPLVIVHGMRPGANQAHVTGQNVPELRNFIKAVLAEKLPNPGYAWIVTNLEAGPFPFIQMAQVFLQSICVSHHGAELNATELAAFSPDAFVAVEYGPRRIQFHCCVDQCA